MRAPFSPNATAVRFSGLALPYSFDDLVRCLRNLHGDGLQLLAGVASFGAEIKQMDTHGEPPLSAVSLATVMAAILTAYPRPVEYDGSWPVRTLKRPFVVNLCHRAFSVDDEDIGDNPGEFALLRLAIRVHGLQSLLQADVAHEIARAALLVGSVAAEQVSIDADPQADRLLTRQLGIDADLYFAAFFALWTQASTNPFIHLPTLLRHFRDGTNAECALRAVLARHSLAADEASARLRSDGFKSYRGSSRAFALFSEFPFIQVGPDYFVSSPHPFVRLAARASLFFGTRAAARSSGQSAFNHALGERMARYSHGLLCAAMPGAQAWDTHGDADSPGLPDSAFCAGDGSVALLVEVKARVAPASVLVGADDAEFKRTFRELYPAVLAQMIKAAWRLDVKARGSDLAGCVQQARRIVLLGVMPAVPAGLHLPLFRQLIEAEAVRMMPHEVQAWYSTSLHTGRIASWHIDGIDAVEAFVARARGELLSDVIVRWLSEVGDRVQRGAYGPDELAPTFRDYLGHLWADRDGEPFPVVEEVYREQMRRVRSVFAGALGVTE